MGLIIATARLCSSQDEEHTGADGKVHSGRSTQHLVRALKVLGYTQFIASAVAVAVGSALGWAPLADGGFMWINAVNVVVAVVGLLASFMFLSCAYAIAGADRVAIEKKLPGAGYSIDPELRTFAGFRIPVSQGLATGLIAIKLCWFIILIGVYAGILQAGPATYASDIAFTVIYALYVALCVFLWRAMHELEEKHAEFAGNKPSPA